MKDQSFRVFEQEGRRALVTRRRTLTENVETFVQRSIKRHTKEKKFAAVAEDFLFLGRFYEMQDEGSTTREVNT